MSRFTRCPQCGYHTPKMSSKQRGEIIAKALRIAKKKGVHIGRPVGFDWDLAIELRRKGNTIREIAETVGAKPPSVQRVMKLFNIPVPTGAEGSKDGR